MFANITGSNNVAFGKGALRDNSSGSGNIGIGYYAGSNLTTGKYNIDIGNSGAAGESGIIRVGSAGTQTAAYIAGISTTQVTGAQVYVTAAGQLGVLASSERYKTAIRPIGKESAKLQLLRPVSFHLRNQPDGLLQYGLIAEEVTKVYPEIVIRNSSGGIEGVRYEELTPMLLNELQQQRHTIASQAARLRKMQEQLDTLQALVVTGKLKADESMLTGSH